MIMRSITIKANYLASLILVAILVTSVFTAIFVGAQGETTITERSFVETASYVIWKDGSTYYAKIGETGQVTSSTNASYLIQSAIDYLTSGGKIFLKTAKYLLSSGLTVLVSGVELEGEGNSTILELEDGVNEHLITVGEIGGDDITRVIIRYLNLDGNGNNQNSGNCIITHTNAKFVLIDSCYVHDAYYAGISLDGERATITRNWVSNCSTYGIYCHSFDANILGNQIHSNIDVGIRITANGILLVGNAINANGGIGVLVEGELNEIQGNQLDYNEVGIKVEGIKNGIIGNSICHENTSGVLLWTGAELNIIGLNTIDSNKQNGIYMTGTDKNMIIENVITGNNVNNAANMDGIRVVADSDNNILRDNLINNMAGHQKAGIRINTADCNDTRIIDNDLEGAGAIIIVNSGTGTIIKGNLGFVTENSISQVVADDEWVVHGLASTPTHVSMTSGNVTYDSIAVIVGYNYASMNTTHVQSSVYWSNSTAITDDVILATFDFKYEP